MWADTPPFSPHLICPNATGKSERRVGIWAHGDPPWSRRTCLDSGAGRRHALPVRHCHSRRLVGQGLARQLLASLIQVARDRGFKSMTGTTMNENRRMLDFARSMGFEVGPDLDDPRLRVMDIDL